MCLRSGEGAAPAGWVRVGPSWGSHGRIPAPLRQGVTIRRQGPPVSLGVSLVQVRFPRSREEFSSDSQGTP